MKTPPRIAFAAVATAGLMVFGAGGAVAGSRASGAVSAQIEVVGSGQVTLDGGFLSYGLIGGRATGVRMVDRGGNATLSVGGRTVPQRGRVRSSSQAGRYFANGALFLLEIRGSRVSVSASGVGVVRLRGSGQYRVDGAAPVSWSGSLDLQVGSNTTKAVRRGQRPATPTGARY